MTLLRAAARALNPLLLAIAMVGALAASAFAQPGQPPTAAIEAARVELDRVEARLNEVNLRDDELAALRARLDPLAMSLDGAINAVAPDLAAADARLAQIGPKPKDGEPAESPDTARERDAQIAARQRLDESIKLGRLIQVEAAQLGEQISARRRALLAERLFEQSRSLASPALWVDAMRETPADFDRIGAMLDEWSNAIERRADAGSLGLVGGAALLALVLLFPVRRRMVDLGERLVAQQAPQSRLRRSLVALFRLLGSTLAPLFAAVAIYWAMRAAGWLPDRISRFALMAVFAAGFLGFTHGIMRALLAPRRPSWRMVELSDKAIAEIKNQPVWVALALVAGRLFHYFNEAAGASLTAVILESGVFALLNAATFAIALRRIRAAERVEAAERAGKGESFGSPFLSLLRLLAWVAVAAVLASVLTGYVAFAQFLANQVIWIAAVVALAWLLLKVVDDLFTTGLSAETRLGRSMSEAIGVSTGSLEQVGVLLSGLVRLMVFGLAAVVVLAPWGFDTTDVFGWLRYAVTGIQFGGIRISLAGVLGAVLLVFVGFAVTRLVQRWLDKELLPKTRMDAGLKASVNTAVGYVGGLMVIVAAIGYLGFGLDRFAIIAGALSVGIGFGLQAVISNFVSGVILLAERPIKAGDWIVIGADEGNVRRISVRSTEIELFDRSTLIVPNSDFITKSVKNVTHGNPVGRVKIDFSVSSAVDPNAVKAIAVETAKGHSSVLAFPEPQLFLTAFTADANSFSMFCNVPSPRQAASVKSDLNFALIKAFADAKVGLGGPAAPSVVDAADRIGEVLGRFGLAPKAHEASDAPLAGGRAAGQA